MTVYTRRKQAISFLAPNHAHATILDPSWHVIMRKIAGVVMQRMNWKIDPREDEGAPADPASSTSPARWPFTVTR
jgi:hypothetical protein